GIHSPCIRQKEEGQRGQNRIKWHNCVPEREKAQDIERAEKSALFFIFFLIFFLHCHVECGIFEEEW
ncbi:MAG: hypothetical protein K6E18_10175, partial [Lachnospiraceae bacterium]|nr:hypothetical protein [Lachnospiraceae bacterium]